MGTRIRAVELLAPEAYVRTYQGVITKNRTTGLFEVNVMGNTIAAKWADPITVAEGDTVLVQFGMGRTQGLNTCTVVGRLSGRARPERGTVTVVPPSSNTVSIQGEDGVTYLATFVTSYSPVVGDGVKLSWTSSTPTIIGKIAATAAPAYVPPPVAAPPAAPTQGANTYWATDSNTYWPPGGWGSWAGGRGRVYQGNYGSGDVYGAYFYNGGPRQMAGRTIRQCRLALGNRLAVGSYNAAATIHIYATSNSTRPGGNITTVGGPVNVTAWPGQGLTEYDITALAGHLQNGGGIAIYGSPYAGFLGIPEQPDSGRLAFDWSM
jgi:hypothetical protein